MLVFYITHDHDQYEITVDLKGNLEQVLVRYGNCSGIPEPVEPADLPLPVLSKLTNRLINTIYDSPTDN